ncbi:exporter of polyketide antibiotics [Actinomadura sp. NBRC 104425]|uniref:ABC transporter permease n=1 Tax=Actinomadura sp. NBRC 104425 TaxID=3032204 RepID=UPI0024A38E11|nr:ABC transporter permease [Actinomadura sp. NBRC 104425]GLZ12695.1 exporter of polyketide antibiotics [Actinomadura sp. NBRC 104425]
MSGAENRGAGHALVGTGAMVRLILRRDRAVLPIWVLLIAVMPAAFVASFEGLFPTEADRLRYARTSGTSPTFLALYGPLHGTDPGALAAQRAGFIPVIVALVCALTVIRHTRVEEETGRRELLGATVLGRGAGLAAALLVAMGASAVLGALTAAAMAAGGVSAAGAVALGLQFTMAGWVFAAAAAVAAQVTEGAGAARGLSVAALGAAFAVRMAADAGGRGNGLQWLSWLSPLGWGTRLAPFGDERWWVLLLGAALVAVLVAAAGMLSGRRDVGAGILPPSLGPAEAPVSLSGPFGLAWRLHSRPLYGWLAGFAALGVVFGGVADGVGDLVKDNPGLEEIVTRLGGRTAITDAYFASATGLLGVFAAGYAVSAVLRMRAEEASLRAEPVLAAAVGRLRWQAAHLVFPLLGPAAALAVAGTAAGLVHGLDSGDAGGWVPRVAGAALAQLPAVWTVAAAAVALVGLAPRAAAASWGGYAAVVVISLFGPTLRMDQWVRDVSPFDHVPELPGGEFTAAPLVWLAAAAAVLTAAGMGGFRRRDLSPG